MIRGALLMGLLLTFGAVGWALAVGSPYPVFILLALGGLSLRYISRKTSEHIDFERD